MPQEPQPRRIIQIMAEPADDGFVLMYGLDEDGYVWGLKTTWARDASVGKDRWPASAVWKLLALPPER